MHHCAQLIAAGITTALAAAAGAQVTLISQERVIEATATANDETVFAAAADFSRFLTTVRASVLVETPDGPVPNDAETGIDCVVDPDAIKASGFLAGTGALTVTGTPVFGEAGALINVTFSVATPTSYRIFATPKPSDYFRDEFEIELGPPGGAPLFRFTELNPPQTVDTRGTLQPGTYTIHYEVEFTAHSPSPPRDFRFEFLLNSTCATADFNNDGATGDDSDIEAYFRCLGGDCCPLCWTADFNGDGASGQDNDIEAFFLVLGTGICPN